MPELLTIDSTVVRDAAEPRRPRHNLALELLRLHCAGEVELIVAPQGSRLDADGELAGRMGAVLAQYGVPVAPQLAYLTEVTFPSSDLFPGFFVHGFGDAWNHVLASWRTHEARVPDSATSPDRFHAETHVKLGRDVFIADDHPLCAMCRRLRDEHGFAVTAMSLADYLEQRAASGTSEQPGRTPH